MHHFLKLFTLLAAISLIGCGGTLPTFETYKLDVQQGNVVTSEKLLKLRPGMTKSQVKFIMGTPLLEDSFHTSRWDYYYQLREGGKIVDRQRVILDFEHDLLKRVRGDVVPEGTTADDLTQQLKDERETERHAADDLPDAIVTPVNFDGEVDEPGTIEASVTDEIEQVEAEQAAVKQSQQQVKEAEAVKAETVQDEAAAAKEVAVEQATAEVEQVESETVTQAGFDDEAAIVATGSLVTERHVLRLDPSFDLNRGAAFDMLDGSN